LTRLAGRCISKWQAQDRAKLSPTADDETVATFVGGLWRTQTDSFLVFGVGLDVSLIYSNGKAKSLRHGPFEKLFAVDGTIHAGERDGTILARFDGETSDWLRVIDKTPWPNIVFANTGG
jgi:hypothetical protein